MTTSPLTIIGLSGSLRKASYNSALIRAAAASAPAHVRVQIETIRGIPVYDGDEEAAHGIPEPVRVLKDAIAAADGLLLASPEYNGSIPGPFKNAIDWLSRPPKDMARVFQGKPVGLIGASPGRGGTRLSQTAWLAVLRALGTQPWLGRQLYVASAGSVFADGEMADERIQGLLTEYITGFAEHVRLCQS